MSKILVTGSNGQLGNELQQLANNSSHKFIFTDREELDITQQQEVVDFFQQEQPEYCINCAAYTQVDKAESDQEMAFLINEAGAKNLAFASAKANATLIQVSTDFVFGGSYSRYISEEQAAQPTGVYAESKLAGEQAVQRHLDAHVIIRTAWLYSSFGGNFVKTMRRLGAERDKLTVIADQIGAPTYARDLALVILQVIEQLESSPQTARNALYGLYHYSNEGVASWYDFAHAVVQLSGLKAKVEAIPTEAYPTPAKRPSYSLLNKHKIKSSFEISIPHWRDSLIECIQLLETK